MRLAYGHGVVELALPPATPVVEGPGLTPLADPEVAVCQALRNPIASPPLKELVGANSKIVILVSDSTRPTGADIFIPVLLAELEEAGVPDENITFIVGTGAHGVLSAEELEELLPADVRHRFQILSHDCFDQEQLTYVGTTSRGNKIRFNKLAVEADLRILTGAVSVHPFAGFGGGRKALFPGVAGYETICFNHSLMLDPQAAPSILEGNPVHEDFMEGIAFVGPKFLLNSIVDEKGQIAAIVAGHVNEAHRAGTRIVLSSAAAPVSELADTVVASAGGFPYDINLYQAVKALQNAARIVKPGGRIILIAECSQGVGSQQFSQWAPKRLSSAELARQLKEQFVLGKHKCYFVSEILERSTVYLYSSLDMQLVESFGFVPLTDLATAPLQGKVVVLPRATATLPMAEVE
ncbi:MAG: nickel-dependent lactate racemase [Firmicutes bacterium]|nr:nickel-dependent lactate racemase [Bacillota bacterium]